MFDDFLKNCTMNDEIKPTRKRVKKNISVVRSLVANDGAEAKRKIRLKPLIIAAVIMATSAVLLFTASGSTKEAIFNFVLDGEKIECKCEDYVDAKGYRRVTFGATLPIYATNFAWIYDVDAPRDKALRFVTDETDSEFMNKLRRYIESDYKTREPEDFGLIFKDSEICEYHIGYLSWDNGFYSTDGVLGGDFMHTGAAYGHPSGTGGIGTDSDGEDNEYNIHYDRETQTKTWRERFYYYIGKE